MGNNIFTNRIKGITKYYARDNIYKFSKGDFLKVVTEFDNPYDSNAIALYDIHNHKLGYIDKFYNSYIYENIKDNDYFCVIISTFIDNYKPSIEYGIVYRTSGSNEAIPNAKFSKYLEKYNSIIKSKNINIFDQSSLQHINFALLALRRWCSLGKEIWTFEIPKSVKTEVKINNKLLNTIELNDYATLLFEQGNYIENISAYIHIINAFITKYNKIPIIFLKLLVKSFICINYYYVAFDIISSICTDIEELKITNNETLIMQRYHAKLINLSIVVADHNEIESLLSFTKDFSGRKNYEFIRDINDVKNEMKKIRNRVKKVYKY